MVQTARKSNWETINTLARKEIETDDKTEKTEEKEQDSEQIEVDNFYSEEEEEEEVFVKKTNAFALLDEVEA